MPKVPNGEQLELRRRADGRLSASGIPDPEMPLESDRVSLRETMRSSKPDGAGWQRIGFAAARHSENATATSPYGEDRRDHWIEEPDCEMPPEILRTVDERRRRYETARRGADFDTQQPGNAT